MKESDIYRQIVSQVFYVNNLFEIAAGRSLLVKFKKKKQAPLNTKQNFDFFFSSCIITQEKKLGPPPEHMAIITTHLWVSSGYSDEATRVFISAKQLGLLIYIK